MILRGLATARAAPILHWFTKLRRYDFKIRKETGNVALAPVTLLLGAHSSGKSSLIQSFLLLPQTALSTDDGVAGQ